MTYDPTIPAANDLISNSQGDIQTNFTQLNTLYDRDHFTWNDATAANRGYHRKVTYRSVIANPGFATPIASTYTKTVSGKSQLFLQNGAAASDVYQITSERTTYIPTVVQSGGGAITFGGLTTNAAYWQFGKSIYVYAAITWNSSNFTGNIRISLPTTPTATSYGFASSSSGAASIAPFTTAAYVIPANTTSSGFSTSLNVVNTVTGGSIVIFGLYQ